MGKLSFNEAMILGAVMASKINPYQPETWNNCADFYRGLARIAKALAEEKETELQHSQEQFEFWEKGNDIEIFKKRVKEVIESLKKKELLSLSWIQ